MIGPGSGLLCRCVVEVRNDDALHVIPCCTEHATYWAEHLSGVLAEMGLHLPIVYE